MTIFVKVVMELISLHGRSLNWFVAWNVFVVSLQELASVVCCVSCSWIIWIDAVFFCYRFEHVCMFSKLCAFFILSVVDYRATSEAHVLCDVPLASCISATLYWQFIVFEWAPIPSEGSWLYTCTCIYMYMYPYSLSVCLCVDMALYTAFGYHLHMYMYVYM